MKQMFSGKTIGYHKVSDVVTNWLDTQDDDSFKCPPESELVAFFNSLDDRQKQCLVSMSSLSDDDFEIPEEFCEAPLITH